MTHKPCSVTLMCLLVILFGGSCSTGSTPQATAPATQLPPSGPTSVVQTTLAERVSPTPLNDIPQPQTPSATLPSLPASELVQPADLTYLGAFRLPDGAERPLTFEYGGNAMTYRPGVAQAADRLPGSLFISGHDRLPYGELPDGSQIAEVSIPIPSSSEDVYQLPQAEFIQGFQDVAAGYFTQMEEIVRMGMLYLDQPPGSPKIHLAWGQHFEPDPPAPTHAWFSPDLSNPDLQGTWFIGQQSFYAVNDYLFEIPQAWADDFSGGRYLATGRFRDGGWGGMGPAVFAYRPWLDDGSAPPDGTRLSEVTLLLYESSLDNEVIERCLEGYQHADEWVGGAWLTSSSGKTALLVAGTKASGGKYWYGYTNPAGPELPCVDGEFVGQFPVCRLADGSDCPSTDLQECSGHDDYRGWWSSRFDAQLILYNPDDLARVALGELEAWQPQPYAVLDIDEHLFFNPPEWDQPMLGTGDQRRYRLGDVAYDRQNGFLYVLELFAEGAKPVVHVWQVE